MENLKKFENSVSTDEFVRGLLLISKDNTLGAVWEKVINCNNCIFEKQCAQITSTLEDQDKYPTCQDVINILTGERTVEDIM